MEDGVSSSGTLGIYPVYSVPVYYAEKTQSMEGSWEGEQDNYLEGAAANYIMRSSSTNHTLAYINGSPVTYKKVTERTKDGNKSLGRTERYFSSFEKHPVITHKPFPFTPPDYLEWRYGLLDSVLTYTEENILIKKEQYKYQDFQDFDLIPGKRLENFRSITIVPVKYIWLKDGGYGIYWQIPCYFLSNIFYPNIGRSQSAEVITFEYNKDKSFLKTEQTLKYDPKDLYLKSRTLKNSNNNLITTSYNYPKDFQNDVNIVYKEMVSHNIINPIIEEIQFKNSNILFRSKKNYFEFKNNVYAPKTVSIKVENLPEEIRIRYHEYDESGKPLTVSKENNIQTTYLYGYKNNLIIAEIQNAKFSEVEAALGGPSILSEITNSAVLTTSHIQSLNNLRNALPKALITTFIHNPLFGVTSKIDEINYATYYEYDDFGRLKLIKDFEGNIVQTYDYQYKQ
ncbi:MAG: hypothetical protein M3512_15185 [Bacteroidota bacterium]|nr:hypothetical protein [Bacteroidota bacterium]